MSSNRFNFTKASIEALPLPAAGERATYHDQHTAGLQLRVTASGKKTFSLYKRAKGGKPERVTLGSFTDGVTVEQARTKALKLKSAMSEGVSPTMALRAARAELTFGEAFDMYIRDHAVPHGLKSINNMRGDFERYLGALPKVPKKKHGKERGKSPGSVNWQDRKLSAISQSEVKDLRASLARECGSAAANHALKLVRVVFNKMGEWGEFKGEKSCARCGAVEDRIEGPILAKAGITAALRGFGQDHEHQHSRLHFAEHHDGGTAQQCAIHAVGRHQPGPGRVAHPGYKKW
jgi:hypothetical protein